MRFVSTMFTSLCARQNLCVCVKKTQNISDIFAAVHLRGPGELAHKPADYLRAPQGLTPLLHKLPRLNTSYSLARSFLPLFLSSRRSFISHHLAPPGTFAAITAFACPPLFSLGIFLLLTPFSPPRCFPGAAPTCRFTHDIHSFDGQVGKQAGR